MQCVSLWIGDRLGPVERACLRSVLKQGHALALYCYDEVAGVPDGVELREATQVLPRSAVFFHRKNGSVALFSDWFRYELQRRALGTWLDTDVYLLRPLNRERAYLMGEQEPGLINNAVLRLPPDSPMLGPLLRVFERSTTPNWLPLRSYIPLRARELLRGRIDVASLPWGSTGPHAVTAVAARCGLSGEAMPPECLFPARWQDADWIVDPRRPVDQIVSSRTIGIHLWNDRIKNFKDAPAPHGSFLHRLQREGGEP